MTVTLPPVATNWLPELHEGKDGEREIIKVVNQLRRRSIGPTPGTGSGLFSTDVGRGDVLGTFLDGAEVVGLSLQLPHVFPAFTLNFSADVLDTASDGIFRVRLGGTSGNADGVEVARLTATTAVFQYQTVTVPITGNGQTLLQVTLQSSAGNTAQLHNGFVIGN